jgi:hypothetical protein
MLIVLVGNKYLEEVITNIHLGISWLYLILNTFSGTLQRYAE